MLCYRCGSHVPDSSERCESCGQQLVAGSARRASSAFQRRRAAPVVEGAPYRNGDLIAGRYEVKEIAGAGPVGFLFRARDKELDVEVAVKVVNARLVQTLEEREGFSRVIRLGRKLSHQNLARVNEDGEERGFPFYTTPYLDGLSLRKIIDLRQSKAQVFTLQEVEPILGQIANGLTSAHKVGPHANLKPENIIVLPDLLKITDFGLGSALPRAPFVQAQRTRKVDGYFAPEFLKGAKPDARMDVYAMGVILGEMLTGLLPEEGLLPELTRKRPELPLAVEALYRKALNENPQSRFQTANELFQEFCVLLAGTAKVKAVEPPQPLPPPVPEPPRAPAAPLRHTGEKAPPPASSKPTLPSMEAPPPPDATQPFDASMLPFLLGETPLPPTAQGKPVDATQPLDASMLPFALEAARLASLKSAPRVTVSLDAGQAAPTASLRPPRQQQPPRDATQPLDPARVVAAAAGNPDNSPTVALDASALPALSSGALSSTSTPIPRRSNALLWLVLATAAAGILGALGGYLLLEWSRQKPPEPTPVEAAVGGAPAAPLSCPPGMALVPAGTFQMGTALGEGVDGFDERSLAPVDVGVFCVDLYEYPNQAGQKPKANVTWAESKTLCESRGQRLCTEQEWEKACKGPRSARFPYGEAFDPNACNTEDSAREERELAGSGQFPRCRSGYGVLDLSGNLAEWTSTPYAKSPDVMTQKGGAFDRTDYAARCSARRNGSPSVRAPQVGFRCCADAR